MCLLQYYPPGPPSLHTRFLILLSHALYHNIISFAERKQAADRPSLVRHRIISLRLGDDTMIYLRGKDMYERHR